jgi:hypothetical protein
MVNDNLLSRPKEKEKDFGKTCYVLCFWNNIPVLLNFRLHRQRGVRQWTPGLANKEATTPNVQAKSFAEQAFA